MSLQKKKHFFRSGKPANRVPTKVIWWTLKRKSVKDREIFATTKLYKSIRTSVKIDSKSKELEKVRIHQDIVLSPLLLAVVMNEITKKVRRDVKELQYADGLVLLGDSWRVEKKYAW